MISTTVNTAIAKQSLQESLQLITAGSNEQVIRDSFTSHLRQIFPDSPGWVVRHIQGSEAAMQITRGERRRAGFVDNLVDLTAIEYESNLTIPRKFDTGYNQVKDYCSGLVNSGHDPELILGILSDTVRWYAYEIDISNLPEGIPCTRDNIVLKQIAHIDCSAASDKSANDLTQFLLKYLGRIGARPVSAYSIARDLGFGSPFCERHILSLSFTVASAFSQNPRYTQLIENLWCNFVSYLREDGQSDQFDLTTYVDEYYILTLGKLICANYLERRALSSDDAELEAILNGKFFENKGLINFVEYDYFGWLNTPGLIVSIIPIARDIQQDLVAYDFSPVPGEDLFGQLMAQLANRSQRLLLGQEWTPGWLSQQVVTRVVSQINSNEPLRLIDMCCGSGSMIVAALKISMQRILSGNPGASEDIKLQYLITAITGFDIDPLAVMLSKINWVLTIMDWIQPLGAYPISIPIYHADSLFAITPISNNTTAATTNVYVLRIAEYSVDLPAYLVSPRYRTFFDHLIDSSYRLVTLAPAATALVLSDEDILMQVESIRDTVEADLDATQITETCSFFSAFTHKIDLLNRDGRNGIWAYILRNSFRPGLVLGQFNGLVSNPPWLALSKVANNPYQVVLKQMATDFDIKPPGASHLHIELATIFLLHAVQQYLVTGASIGCITPETVLNGHHHNPFRQFRFSSAGSPVPFDIKEIWKVQEHVFKNNAIVLFGEKSLPSTTSTAPLPGKTAYENGALIPTTFYRNSQGRRTAWSEQPLTADDAGFYEPANFRQGADIMPRRLLFYEVSPSTNARLYNVESINPMTSRQAFTLKDAKKHASFHLRRRQLPKDLFFNVITSNLLTPFDVVEFQKALLPIQKNASGKWVALTNAAIVAKGPVTQNTINEICHVIRPQNGSVADLFKLIDTRGKLTQQIITAPGFIVMTGAGGGKVCSAYINAAHFDASRLILDQTVYWAQVTTEDEAIYLTGLFNSDAINLTIEEFQPRGAFGKRHVHKLPFGVTPPYDAIQTAHQDVVEKTKRLMAEYEQLKTTSAEVVRLLDPNSGTLPWRRRRFMRYITQLPAYQEYEQACRALYGL